MLKIIRNKQNRNLAKDQKGGTDLLEVLMLVALFALGLVVAIGAFRGSVEQKMTDVGNEVNTAF